MFKRGIFPWITHISCRKFTNKNKSRMDALTYDFHDHFSKIGHFSVFFLLLENILKYVAYCYKNEVYKIFYLTHSDWMIL